MAQHRGREAHVIQIIHALGMLEHLVKVRVVQIARDLHEAFCVLRRIVGCAPLEADMPGVILDVVHHGGALGIRDHRIKGMDLM
ncbi:hypothetical protein D3C87_1466330 [compost metagenome]